jgi:pathogenesis-related protein 1
MAQAWAVHLAEVGRFEHHPQRVGQNLFYGSGIANITPSFVVQSWLDESKDYDEHKARCSDGADCGHFTQVIWKGSKVLGCGAASGGGRRFWACFYNPPGNIIGSRPY